MKKMPILLGLLALLGFVASASLFIVDEREKALVLQFGEVRAVKEEPGLALKLPIIQEVVRYDDRILPLDTQPLEVTHSDDRRLVVDAFARWRISDAVQFRRAVGTSGLMGAAPRLERILNAQLRGVLGKVPSDAVLSPDRAALMIQIRDNARDEAASLGVEIVDVRIKRADLPQQNLEATFARMRAEREREAADEIARGNEAAQKVRAQADRAVIELTSAAQRDAEVIRGEADADRERIYAEAYGRDVEFFTFYSSLQAYTEATKSTTYLVSTENDFFDYLRSYDAPAAAAEEK